MFSIFSDSHYCGGSTPDALVWKDAACSRFAVDTDRDGEISLFGYPSAVVQLLASLTSVSLLGNKFDDEAASLLLKVKEEKSALITLCGLKPEQTEANFSGWGLGSADVRLLAPEVAVSASLTKVLSIAGPFSLLPTRSTLCTTRYRCGH